jgi:hypothetical protein
LQAYILINTGPARLREVADVCKKIQGIKMAHAVTGQFDVVAYADRIRMDDLKTMIKKIQNPNGSDERKQLQPTANH